MRAHTSVLRLTVGLLLAAHVVPTAAAGQGGHPLPQTLRPLHERVAEADAVVVATVGEVTEGRIELVSLESLVGQVAPGARVKRAPSNPLPVSSGDRVLLLLRGARSPYLSVDSPRETVRLASTEAEARWSEAIRVLDGSRDDPEDWVELYTGWLETGPGSLRDLAVASLSAPGAPYQPLPASFFAARAEVAWDGHQSAETRRASGRLAILHPAGAGRLATHADECPPHSDPDVVELSAIAAIRFGAEKSEGAVLCALSHANSGVRLSAAKALGRTTGTPTATTVRARLAELATGDDESFVREAAQQALARLE